MVYINDLQCGKIGYPTNVKRQKAQTDSYATLCWLHKRLLWVEKW